MKSICSSGAFVLLVATLLPVFAHGSTQLRATGTPQTMPQKKPARRLLLPTSQQRQHQRPSSPVKRRTQVQVPIPAGVWTPRGYGFPISVSSITANTGLANAFEETNISCIMNNDLLEGFQFSKDFELDETDENLAYVDVGINVPYLFDRSDEFQSGCKDGVTATISDPEYVRDALQLYDIFTQTFLEHYAYFDLREIDWMTATAQTRAMLATDSTDEELRGALVSLLEPLDDMHVFLDSGTDYFTKPLPIIEQLYAEFFNQTIETDIDRYIEG